MVRRALLLSCLLVAAGLAPARPCLGGQDDALIDRGVELRTEGKDAEALETFQRAFAMSRSARALAQIALAEQALGSWVDAERHLEGALAEREDPWIVAHRAVLEEALGIVKEHVGSLELRSNVAGAKARFNGVELGGAPFAAPVRVTAGVGSLEVFASGYQKVSRSVVIRPGELTRETVDLAAIELSAVSPPTSRAHLTVEREPSTLRTLGWITGVGAAGGLGLGLVGYLVRESSAKRYNDDSRCLAGGLTRVENCRDDRDAARSAETLSAIGFVAGGVLVAASVVLFSIAPASDDVGGAPREGTASSFGLAVRPGMGGLRIACFGRFE